jgi:hypothetical protein
MGREKWESKAKSHFSFSLISLAILWQPKIPSFSRHSHANDKPKSNTKKAMKERAIVPIQNQTINRF